MKLLYLKVTGQSITPVPHLHEIKNENTEIQINSQEANSSDTQQAE